MNITSKKLALLAIAISTASLLAAFFFQYVMGLVPCELCIVQRWAHAYVILTGALFLALPRITTAILGLIASVHVTYQAVFHAGVEWGFWEGPEACSGGSDIGAMSAGDLLDFSGAGQVISCADPAWVFLGLSMAGWNALIGLDLIALWVYIIVKRRNFSRAKV
ncbi:MAG: disulfide bond formation protein B [Roseibium sp.]|uniref:disulfide bond formation protein B n=1 Tax=Roseibium sp. TaxID=1936156 RepID=UPI00329909AB